MLSTVVSRFNHFTSRLLQIAYSMTSDTVYCRQQIDFRCFLLQTACEVIESAVYCRQQIQLLQMPSTVGTVLKTSSCLTLLHFLYPHDIYNNQIKMILSFLQSRHISQDYYLKHGRLFTVVTEYQTCCPKIQFVNYCLTRCKYTLFIQYDRTIICYWSVHGSILTSRSR